MGRLAYGCALLAALVALAAATSASANTITTVAGGGTVTPLDYEHTGGVIDPLSNVVPSPAGIAWSGSTSGLYYVVTGDGTCVQLWHEFDPASFSYGFEIEGGAWQTCGVQAGGYPTPVPAYQARLNNPCCVTSNWQWDQTEQTAADGPLVASSGSGHVNFYSWPAANNTGQTVAGSTSPSDCNSTSLTPVDNVSATSAQFCEINGLAQQYTPPYSYAIAERNRGPHDGVISFVDKSVNPPIVHHVANAGGGTTPFKFGPLAWDRSNDLVVSDRESGIWMITRTGNTWNPPALIAGEAGGSVQGFGGDGGPANQATFANVEGLAVGFDNALYIADADNCRIRKISQVSANPSSTTVSTAAGDGCDPNASLGDNGPSTTGNLSHPVGVAIAPIGLLISDTGHNRIRLVDRTSIIDPPAITGDNTPSFNITSLDTPSHIKCKVDGADVPCAGIGPLLDGAHTLAAWENGNVANAPDPPDPTPAVANFTVDTTGPAGVALSSPAADAVGVPVDTEFAWTSGADAAAGIDHYEIWINDKKDRDVPTSACAGGSCVARSAHPLPAGHDTWQIRAVDKLGNSSATPARSLTAGGPPKAAFTISPNPSLAGRSIAFDASSSADESGIARYEWDLDGDGSFETDGGGSPTTTRSYPAATSVTIRLRVTDGTGDQSTAEQTLKVTQPTSGSNLLGVTIDNGAQYTNDPNVTLSVKAPANANALLVSNDGGFLAPATFPTAPTIPWKLDSSGPERLPKTVYLRFMLGPIVSDNYTDDIILDEIPPVVQTATLVPSRLTTKASSAALLTFAVKVKAKDSNSGVGKVQVASSKKSPSKLVAYATRVKVKLGSRPKFIRAQDHAGNFSPWKKLR